jgi:hypothetical protein
MSVLLIRAPARVRNDRLMTTFAGYALVNDQLQDHWGRPAIRDRAKRDIIDERFTMNVTNAIITSSSGPRSTAPLTSAAYLIR